MGGGGGGGGGASLPSLPMPLYMCSMYLVVNARLADV